MKKLVEAKNRIKSAPSRSGSGAEPPGKKIDTKPDFENSPDSSQGNGQNQNASEDPILKAILALTQKVDKISLKTDNMVSKSDLEAM